MLTDKQLENFWAKVDKSGDCWEWIACKDIKGYGQVKIGGKTRSSHRVSWEIENGLITDSLNCLHRCDNPSCVNPAHLFLGTHADNVADREAKGRGGAPYGEKHGRSKLTESAILQIRALRGKYTCQKIGELYGVHLSVISKILLGKSWRYVQ